MVGVEATAYGFETRCRSDSYAKTAALADTFRLLASPHIGNRTSCQESLLRAEDSFQRFEIPNDSLPKRIATDP